jgi:hypothetical protein
MNCGQREIDGKTDICAACGTEYVKRMGFDWVFDTVLTIGIPIAIFMFVFGWWALAAGFAGLCAILWLIDVYWPLKIKRDVQAVRRGPFRSGAAPL